MMNINYRNEMLKVIDNLDGKKAKLLLHSCCGPCSTAVIEELKPYFNITVHYYNPNIFPEEEYLRRRDEQVEYLEKIGIDYIIGKYNIKSFYDGVFGMEEEKEGGLRCLKCFEMRLKETAKIAIRNDMEYFTTTLTVSPHKNSQNINTIGLKVEKDFKNKVKYLTSDFKKNDGYVKSLAISNEENMYRQDYCGCIFSLKEREKYKEKNVKK